MDSEKIALFDLDGTLCNYEGRMAEFLEAMRSPNEPVVDFSHQEQPPYIEARMNAIKKIPGWWLNLPVIPGGIKIMQMAAQIGFNLHVLTKGPEKSTAAWTEKFEWCRRNLESMLVGKSVGVTVSVTKGLTYGTLLVDDYPPYVLDWLKHRPRGLVLMPFRKWNLDFKHDQVVRYPDDIWHQVDETRETRAQIFNVLKAAYER